MPISHQDTEVLAPAVASPSVLVGLIGAGIQGSRSPRMHEREGREQGFTYIYKVIDLEALGLPPPALPELVTAAERMGFAGVNVTHPCKQAVLTCLDELSPEACALGAVNTVVFRGGRRLGYNTDWQGFAESFRREMQGVRLDRVVQFGAGGAGAAVAFAALTLGVGRLSIVDTEPARAARLAAALGARFGTGRALATAESPDLVAAADGIINATPVGMARYPGTPLPEDHLHGHHWVAEIVYFPLETELLRTARALGCRTMSGAGMAVFQAVESFRLFTGRDPDVARMLRHFAEDAP
jgi:shikimate dehydrogenase